MDFLLIGSKKEKDTNVLVITDHFTRYSQAYVTSNQQTSTVAKAATAEVVTNPANHELTSIQNQPDSMSKIMKSAQFSKDSKKSGELTKILAQHSTEGNLPQLQQYLYPGKPRHKTFLLPRKSSLTIILY